MFEGVFRGFGRSLRVAAIGIVAVAAPVHAATATPGISQKRSELSALHGRIDTLGKEVAEAEASRADVADRLKETESAISDTDRRLRSLADRRNAAQKDLSALEEAAARLERQIAAQRGRLGRMLRNRYQNGEPENLAYLLRADDPNQTAQDAHYMARLSQAQADLVAGLRRSLDEKRKLAESQRTKTDEIAAIERQQQKERTDLLAQQQMRRNVLEHIAGDIAARRKEIDSLRRDEQRLSKVIDDLVRSANQQRQRQTEPVPNTAAAHDDSKSARPGIASPGAAPPTEAAPRAIARIEQTPEDSGEGTPFARLKGSLRLPVRGELASRFGAPRQEGHTTWKGLFIRAPEGSEVKAVAAGRVAFVDWLRGFGNLVILDHGDSYFTVYGNNESVFTREGQSVRAGETIAAVGNSGGNAESGLYFELRHQGEPLDPLKWVALK